MSLKQLPRRLRAARKRQLWLRRYIQDVALGLSGDRLPALPDNLIAGDAAAFNGGAFWDADPAWTIADGVATKAVSAGAETLDYDIDLAAGTYWVQAALAASNDFGAWFRFKFSGNGNSSGNLVSVDNPQTYARLYTAPAGGHNTFTLQGLASGSGSVDDVAIYDMAETAAMPCDIYGLWGQSNMVGTDAEPVTFLDTLHPQIWSWARDDSNNYGYVAGALNAAFDPLAHAGNENRGVGPGMAFARQMLSATDGSRRIVLVCCAEPNTRLSTGSAHWAAPSGANYVEAMTAMADCLDACPAGSEIKGILWSQGESDYAAHGSTYAAAFSSTVASARTTLGIDDLPFVIIGTDPDEDADNGGTLQATQELLDENSGDGTAVGDVRYVATPAGHRIAPGSSHMTAEGHRVRGRSAATIMQALQASISADAPDPPVAPSGDFTDEFTEEFA